MGRSAVHAERGRRAEGAGEHRKEDAELEGVEELQRGLIAHEEEGEDD